MTYTGNVTSGGGLWQTYGSTTSAMLSNRTKINKRVPYYAVSSSTVQSIYSVGNSVNSLRQPTIITTTTSLGSTATSFYSGYNNYYLVNNGVNNITITLPSGDGSSSTPFINNSIELMFKKTGTGTVTLTVPSDSVNQVRGINSTTNKNYVLSSSNQQSVRLMYTYGYNLDGTSNSTAEIWHVIKDDTQNIVSSNGSILFAGSTSTYLTLPANDNQLQFRTGDFTVEWWQYQTDSNSFPRIFSFGTYPSNTFAVSIEGGVFYVWINGSANSFGTLTNYKNVYNHFAIVRSGTTIKVFRNGTQLGSNLTSSYDFNDTTNDLRIGNEQTLSTNSAFGGNIKGFHWVKGTALYSSNFTPNYNSISPHVDTHLLLNVSDSSNLVTDSSGLGKTVTNTGCTFSSITHPFY